MVQLLPTHVGVVMDGKPSGEQRLSGFFPWQTSHAEIVVSEKLWPDFTEADFAEALEQYAARWSSDLAP